MSTPFLAFTCTSCNFKGSSMAVWGRFSYESDAGLIPISRQLGWCGECCDLVALEVLPADGEIQKLEAVIAEEAAIVRNFMIKAAEQRSWFRKLIGPSVKMPPEIQDVDFQRTSHEDELKTERSRAELLAGRRSAPKCLRCGSEACLAVPAGVSPSGDDEAPGPPTPIGMEHPGCGGEFMVEHSGIRISKRLNHGVYDRDGVLLRTVQDDEGKRFSK